MDSVTVQSAAAAVATDFIENMRNANRILIVSITRLPYARPTATSASIFRGGIACSGLSVRSRSRHEGMTIGRFIPGSKRLRLDRMLSNRSVQAGAVCTKTLSAGN